MKQRLLDRIESREARIGIVGLGYVGLPLLLEFSKADFQVTGFDVDQAKVDQLAKGESYIRHIEAASISDAFCARETADATTDFSRITECDALLICVPTPLTSHRDPDLSFVEGTAQSLAPYMKKGQLVALESTTYPGTTEQVMGPILEKGSGLTAGQDFFVAYSPEREDPNNGQFSTSTIPKVVGGLDKDSLEVACALYNCVICETVPVSSCRAAEATKLMENIFRCINIALVNELKTVFTEMDIDVWEVVRAASTKPFGFMPFYPGPGLGGHCIPIDPFYLTWKAKEYGISTRFIELAGEVNTAMPRYVVQRTMWALNNHSKSLRGSKVLLVGLAYKKNVDDDRESPTYVLWSELQQQGAEVSYYDPYCPVVRPTREHSQYAGIKSVSWEEVVGGGFDVALISTAHDGIDYDALVQNTAIVVDTRGACPDAPNVVKA
ncbi:MAG: nucleotide sugar dehydrogenase [Kiritimatiellae bacterium]|nr:nucleotide sugar dehydrogenase [Kiritimatiellia bacterium]